MNSWTSVLLLYGLACNIASTETSVQTSHNKDRPDLNCAFEESLCLWKDVSRSSRLRWKTYRGGRSSYTSETGPSWDHTTGNGYYLAMRTSYSYEPRKALLESPPIASRNETCLSFWYFMAGRLVGSLNVYKIGIGGAEKELFTMFGPQGKRWYRAVINSGDGVFKLQIEATSSARNSYGDIAIDDVTFSYQACKHDASALLKHQPRFDCNFEDGLCGWSFERHNKLTWYIRKVPPNSNDRNALPPRSNGTSYVEMVRTRPGSREETKLQGPSVSVDSRKACLSFWYRVNGTTMNWFQVKTYEYGASPYYEGKIVFSTSFKSGQVWIQGFVTLTEGDHFQVVFVTSSAGSRDGSLALDDVRLTQGGPCIEDKESLINCDFERDFCQWYMKTKKDEDDWVRAKGPTPTNATGPSQDHTTGDGYYIYLDASHVQQAILYSAPFSVNASGACLSFWYYMHGADVHTLELRSTSSGYRRNRIEWSLKGPQGDQWIHQSVSIPNADSDMNLVFTAKRGYFPRGDIALDDISITFGAPCESDLEKETITVSTAVYPEITSENVTTARTVTDQIVTEAPRPDPPQLLVHGKINPAYENSRVELECQHDDEESLIFKWYKRDINSVHRQRWDDLNRWNRRLVFNEVQARHEGIYVCAVQLDTWYDSDTASNASNEVEIKVVPDRRPSPNLRATGRRYDDVYFTNTVDVDAMVDTNVTLTCGFEIDGGEYHWTTTSEAFNSLDLPRERVFVINGTHPIHSGRYSCEISKDEYWTSKSNELNLAVRPGKRCHFDHSCRYEDDFDGTCQNTRCQCRDGAVVRGRGCQKRPEKPRIVTSPEFFEFGIGESFYVVCEADEPAPVDAIYTFKKDNNDLRQGPLNILKITNATEGDSNDYGCHITSNGIDSVPSHSIHIQILDFIDLNCDFDKDLCAWSQKEEIDTANFVYASSTRDDHGPKGEQGGQFLQLEASNTTVPNRAVLVSPTIDRMALNACLTFWYRMHGTDVHSLSVWSYALSRETERFGGKKWWTVIGDKGDIWFKQNVTIGSGSKFYIAFDATGQVAIDDVTFTYRGGC